MASHRGRACVGTALIALLGHAAGAQEHPLAAGHPGTWSVSGPVRVAMPPELTPPEKTASAAAVNRLLEIIRRMPSMAPDPGRHVIVHSNVSIDSPDHSGDARDTLITMQVAVNIAPYEQTAQKVEPNERDTVGGVTIRVNDLGSLLNGLLDLRDEQGAFFRDTPPPVGTVHGYPIYEEGNGDRWVVLLRNKVPVWAPVTRARYLQAAIKDEEARLEVARQRRAKLPPNLPASIMATMDQATEQFQRHVTNLRKALAAMSAAERVTPAAIAQNDAESAPEFAPPGDDPTAVIVHVNPALVDPKLPRSTPQVLAVHIVANDDLSPGIAERLDRELDWTALAALLR